MKNDLVERYIYAVTKRLPKKSREDVSLELRGLIEDMLAERCGDSEPMEKDIRVVLTELGSPQELYAKYDENAEKCLIGQPYYSTYLFVMKTVLCAVVGGLVVACTLLQILEPRQWLDFLEYLFSTVFEGVIFGYAAVTLIFSVMQANNWKIKETLDFDDLPPVPQKKQQISTLDTAFNIGFIAVFLVVFLAVPQTFSAVITETGELVPCFDTQVILDSWYILVLFALSGIIRESVKLIEKRYNKKVFVTSAVTNAVSAVLSIWWLCRDDILNPDFLANMDAVFLDDAAFLADFFGRFNLFLMGIMLLALVLDTINAAMKMEKA